MRSPDRRPVLKRPILARCFAATAATLIWTSVATAQTLTAEQAVQLALENAENRVFAEAPAEAAQGAVISAETWRNPVLSVDREGEDGFGGDGSETSVSIERDFDFSGRRTLEIRSAQAELLAARNAGRITLAELRAETLTAFYAVLAAEAEQAAVSALSDQLSALEDATRRRVDAGDASRLELERVRQETLRLPALTAEARLAVQAARDALFVATGADLVTTANPVGDLLPETVSAEALSSLDGSARLSVLEAEVAAAEAREDAASRIAPEVTLGVGVRHIEGMGEETGVLMSASVPLPLFDRNRGEQHARAADARLAEARLRRERRRLEAEAALLARRSLALHETAQSYEAEALTSARELRRIALVSYSAGEIGALEAIDAMRAAFEAERQAISLKHRMREAEIALHALLAETE